MYSEEMNANSKSLNAPSIRLNSIFVSLPVIVKTLSESKKAIAWILLLCIVMILLL